MKTYRGRCHCGAIAFEYRTDIPVADWDVRACQCSFCTRHATACTSDPDGRTRFFFEEPGVLRRYVFGTGVTEFLICARCGVYLGAISRINDELFATLNTRVMGVISGLPEARPVSYDDLDAGKRLERRRDMWTPVTDWPASLEPVSVASGR